jgi:hypothetical protein
MSDDESMSQAELVREVRRLRSEHDLMIEYFRALSKRMDALVDCWDAFRQVHDDPRPPLVRYERN